MPVEQALARPYRYESGNADFLLKTDMLRRAPGAYRELAQQYQQPVLLIEILDSLGLTGVRSKAHKSPYVDFYFAHDDDRYFAIGTVATPQVSAGDPVTVNLAAGEMKVQDNRRFSRPRKMELIQDKYGNNWKITNKITNTGMNPHQLVLTPMSSTTAATFTASDRFFIIGPEGAEATGQPKGLVRDWGMYSNKFAIMKETHLTSGTNMTTDQFGLYQVPGLSKWAYVEGIDEASIRHDRNKSSVIVHGQLGDNVLDYSPDFDTDVLDHSTEGLIEAIETQGVSQTYDEAAGYDLSDLKRATARLRQMRLNAADIAVIQGPTAASNVQEAIVDYLGKEVNIKYFAKKYLGQRYKGGERFSAEDYFISMGFNGARIDNYNLIFREATELSSLYGDDAYTGGVNYDTYQFFIPLTVRKDAKTNATMPSMQLLHRGQDAGGYQRLNEIWRTGGAGPIQKTDEWDVMRCFLRSEICLMLFAGKYSVIQKGGNADA